MRPQPNPTNRQFIALPDTVLPPFLRQFCTAWKFGECRIFVGMEPTGTGGALRWHLSISHPSRYPTWDEIKEARYQLIPNLVTVALVLPPQEQYVNLHPNCFHLSEVDPNY